MKILHLKLKFKWFDMIASGEKKEEYRDLTDYWHVRLMHWDHVERNNSTPMRKFVAFKHFDVVQFKHGYAKDAPTMTFEIIGLTSGTGNEKWGAEAGQEYFVIRLGKRIDNPLK